MTASALVLLLPGFGVDTSLAQASEELGAGRLNCGNFVSAEAGGRGHVEAVFQASGGREVDTYGLDGPPGPTSAGDAGIPCEDDDLLATDPPATCDLFSDQADAQALLDVAGPGVYPIDTNDDGRACTPVDAPPPSEPAAPRSAAANDVGCDSTYVLHGRAEICAGQFARHNDFEGFESFAARAQNGFGAFSDSGGASPTITITPAQGTPGRTIGNAFSSQPTVRTQQQAANPTDSVTTKQRKKAKKRNNRRRQARQLFTFSGAPTAGTPEDDRKERPHGR